MFFVWVLEENERFGWIKEYRRGLEECNVCGLGKRLLNVEGFVVMAVYTDALYGCTVMSSEK